MNILMELFKTIVSMASTASIVIVLVLLLRILLKNAPRKLVYGLWGIVALRLLISVMLPSGFSIFNFFETEIAETQSEVITGTKTGTPNLIPDNIADTTSRPATPEFHTALQDTDVRETAAFVTDITVSVFDTAVTIPGWTVYLWIAGIAFFGIYFVSTYFYLSRKLRFATLVADKTYCCEGISGPFVFGIINPRIYLPYGIEGPDMELILKHEQYHIRKKDPVVKILAFILFAFYWFSPMVWLAYHYSMKDMELRCDEAVLKDVGLETRKRYSNALLAFAGNSRHYLNSPIAFSEDSTKDRIRHALAGHRKSVVLSVTGIIAIVIAGVLCLTDKVPDKENASANSFTTEEITSAPDTNTTSSAELVYGDYICPEEPLPYISIYEDTIVCGLSSASHADIYRYSVKEQTIYAYNQIEEKCITIIDSDTLEMDGVTYTLSSEYASSSVTEEIIHAQVYNSVLTEQDITSAKEAARAYYEATTYIEEIIDICLCKSDYEYQNRVPVKFTPGNVVVLEVEAVWSGNHYSGIRYIVLSREQTSSQWIFHSEGL